MKFLEHEAKSVFAEHGIPIPRGFLIRSADELSDTLEKLPPEFVLKAQVDVGGRGKAGGILIADRQNGVATARSLFGKTIKGVPVREILAEERLPIIHEYLCQHRSGSFHERGPYPLHRRGRGRDRNPGKGVPLGDQESISSSPDDGDPPIYAS